VPRSLFQETGAKELATFRVVIPKRFVSASAWESAFKNRFSLLQVPCPMDYDFGPMGGTKITM